MLSGEQMLPIWSHLKRRDLVCSTTENLARPGGAKVAYFGDVALGVRSSSGSAHMIALDIFSIRNPGRGPAEHFYRIILEKIVSIREHIRGGFGWRHSPLQGLVFAVREYYKERHLAVNDGE
jgi:hypothetical protein